MKTFLLRRFLATIPLLLAITFLTFALLYNTPGDYFTRLAEDPSISAHHLAQLRAQYGLDGGFWYRYWKWLSYALRGDFGYSFENRIAVFDLVMERMGNTLLLAVSSMAFSWVLSIPLGMVAALKRNKLFDKVATVFSIIGLSIPSVFFALLMILFAAKTKWFPTGGIHDQINWDDFNSWQRFWNTAHHLILPTIVLGTGGMAQYMRLMRGSMVETLGQDYIRTARAKGLSKTQVLFKHGFGNAINPLITLFGFSLAHLLSGAFLVEFVMSWPGMARLTLNAITTKDEPLVMAAVVMSGVMLILGNLVSDILLAVVDPRIRLE